MFKNNNVLNKDDKKSCNTEFKLNEQRNNPNQIPEHFNDFFHKHSSEIADSDTHFSTYLSKSTDNTIFFNPITEDEVSEVIKK